VEAAAALPLSNACSIACAGADLPCRMGGKPAPTPLKLVGATGFEPVTSAV
jgi:hypothetical protein